MPIEMGSKRNIENFWKTICQEKNLSQQLRDISELNDGVSFHLTGFGDTRVKAAHGSALGDNYMSDVYQVVAKTQDGTEYNSFIKVLPFNPLFRETAISARLYHREIGMFSLFLPKLEQLRQELSLEEGQVPLKIPRVYYFHTEEPVNGEKEDSGTVIVFEDLKCQGFRNAEFKKKGCSVWHAEMALRSLASYHALSIALVRKFKNPDGSYTFPPELEFAMEKTIFDQQPEEMIRSFLSVYDTFLRNKGELEAAEWLEKLTGNLAHIAKSQNLEDCGPLACITHGDYWNNNIMFNYKSENDNKPIDIRMIDWQISRPGHPVSDVLYFLVSTTTVDTRKQHLDFLLESYFTTLKTSLEDLGIDLELENYNKEHFLKDYQDRLHWALLMGFMLLPNVLDTKLATEAKRYENTNETSSDDQEEHNSNKTRINVEEKFKEMNSTDFLSHNDLLSQRVMELVKEIKEKTSTSLT